jgi:uncharacterized protein
MTFLTLCLALIAILYAMVGHGGASGYIAVLVLFEYSSTLIRQDALVLNIVVSGIAFYIFYSKGYFQWQKFLPLILSSIPLSFLGGMVHLEDQSYKILLGILLLIPAILFLFKVKVLESNLRELPIYLSIIMGGALGFISGISGIGGGIFLSPILVLCRFENQKNTAAISAPFILVNSVAGLAGSYSTAGSWDPNIGYFILAVVFGGFIGAFLGAHKVNQMIMRRVLGIVLFIASIKLLLI